MLRLPHETQFSITISRKDTFNILMVPLQMDGAENQLKKLFSILDEPFYLADRGVKLTASVGVSFYPKDGDNADSLLTNADAAMLNAKQFGGNRFEFYRTEINAQLPKQLALENDLHQAINLNQLQVYYQPLVDLKRGVLRARKRFCVGFILYMDLFLLLILFRSLKKQD